MPSLEITETEKQLGFKIGKMPNPLGNYAFQKKYLDVVLCEIDGNNVVLKFKQSLPLSEVAYIHQCKDGGIWDVAGSIEYDPETAVRKARAKLQGTNRNACA